MIPIVIPAKNEKDNLEDTVNSLRETAKYAEEELFIVVVDDGSKDNTSDIAKKLGCHVVNLPDRGYSALGMPELADTHNAGFKYIDKHLDINSYNYLMVVGADTTFELNYIALLLDAMKSNEKLVMCAGVLNEIKTNYDSVMGSGRMIRNSFWTIIGRIYPNTFYSWESYPLVFANANGFKTRTIYKATMHTPREPMTIVDWRNYGIGMKENGSIIIYVLLRASKRLFKNKDFYGFYRLLYGYFFSSPVSYNSKLKENNANKQLKRICNLLKTRKLVLFFFKVHASLLSFYKSFSQPTILAIELTSLCNASCTMCSKENSSRIKKHMDFVLFKKIIDNAKKININKFQLSFYGESLLYPKLIDSILYIREKIPNAFISMNTNGILLSPKLIEELLYSKINLITISIEGNNKEEYEAIRVKLKWDLLRENIKNLRQMIDKLEYSTKVGIRGLNVGNIKINEKEYIKMWGDYADTIFIRNEHDINKIKKESLFHKLLPCNKLFLQMVILSTGDVVMCAYDWEGVTASQNIQNNSILEIWKEKSLRKKRLMHLFGLKKQLDLCNNCSYRVGDNIKKREENYL